MKEEVSQENSNNEIEIVYIKSNFLKIVLYCILLLLISIPLGFLIFAFGIEKPTVSGIIFSTIIFSSVALFWWFLVINPIKLRKRKTPTLVINAQGYTNYIHKIPKNILWSEVKYFDDDLLYELGRIKVHRFDEKKKELATLDIIKCRKLKINYRKLFNILSEQHKNYLSGKLSSNQDIGVDTKNDSSATTKTQQELNVQTAQPDIPMPKIQDEVKANSKFKNIAWLNRSNTKEKLSKIANSDLTQDEKLIGYFWGSNRVKIIWYFIAGPFAAFGFRSYVVAVTDKAVHFHLLELISQKINTDIFTFDEIDNFSMGQSTLLIRPEITFYFKNGNQISLEVALKPGMANKEIYLNEQIMSHLKANIKEKVA